MSGERRPVAARRVALGALVVVLFSAAIFGAAYLFRNWNRVREQLSFVTFLPATTGMRVGDQITLERMPVARVTALDAVLPAVVLTVTRPGQLEVPVTTTITLPDERVAFTADLSAELRSPEVVWLGIGGDSVMLSAAEGGRWLLGRAPAGLLVDGRAVPAQRILAPRATLSFGGYAIKVGATQLAVRARIGADTARIRKLLRQTGRDGLVGPDLMRVLGGARLEFGSGLGLTREGVRLRLAPFGQGEPWLRREPRELVALESGDLQATLVSMVGYLTSPSGMNQEPSNRFERAVDDVNRTLAQASAASASIHSLAEALSGSVGRDGWVLDAAVGRQARTGLAAAVESVSGQLRSQRVSQVLNFDSTLHRVGGSFERIATNIGGHTDRIGARADTILSGVQHQLTSRDSVTLIDRVKGTTGAVSGAATSAQGTVTGVRKPLVAGLVAGALAAVLGIVSMIAHW